MSPDSERQVSHAVAATFNAFLLFIMLATALLDIRGAHFGMIAWLIATVVGLVVSKEVHRRSDYSGTDVISLSIFTVTFPGRIVFALVQGSSPHLADIVMTAALLVLAGWTFRPVRPLV